MNRLVLLFVCLSNIFWINAQQLTKIFPHERADSVQMAYPKFSGMIQHLDPATSLLVKEVPLDWKVEMVGRENSRRVILEMESTDSGFYYSYSKNIEPEFLRYWFSPDLPETSGSCNVNIACPEGQPYFTLGESIVRITVYVGVFSGSGSGVLVNNTALDGKPYILTAEHNGLNFFTGAFATNDNLQNWEFEFNAHRPTCSNQQPPQNIISYTGCVLRMRSFDGGGNTGSDVALLEINDPSFQASTHRFAGWSRQNTAPASGYGIHHPNGDVKKISFFNGPAVPGVFSQQSTPLHWRLTWSATQSGHGVTEPGSSGSPIFDLSNDLVVGTLTGGAASCALRTAPDYYGMFWHQWDGNGSSSNRQLKPWLDPLNLDPQTLSGKNLSVDEFGLKAQRYFAYPNPSRSGGEVVLPQSVSSHWSVYDLQGRMLFEVEESNVLLAPQSSGTYIIKHRYENIQIPLIVQ